MDGQGSLPHRRATPQGRLQRERHAQAVEEPRSFLAEDAAGAPQGGSARPGRLQKKLRGPIAETAAAHREAGRIEVRLQDEARIGQTGRNCRRRLQEGTRPAGIKDQRHTAVYLFGAVCPERDAAFALVQPVVSTGVMQTFLDQLSREVCQGVHALLAMDRAGWHCASDPVMPDNITAVLLPPCSPELNARERLWLYLKERFLAHRLWPGHDAIVDAACHAWQRVTSDTGKTKSLCSMEWATPVINWCGRCERGGTGGG